jgi:hypothetical protein
MSNQEGSNQTPPGGETPSTSTATAIKPANRAIVKTIKDLNVKKARAEHHRSLINSALKDGRTINGLRREVKPQIPDISVELAIKWEDAHNQFTDTLTKLLAEYWANKRDNIDVDISTALHQLTINGTEEQEVNTITQLGSEACTSETTRLEAPKPQRQRNVRQAYKRLKPGAASTPVGNSRN